MFNVCYTGVPEWTSIISRQDSGSNFETFLHKNIWPILMCNWLIDKLKTSNIYGTDCKYSFYCNNNFNKIFSGNYRYEKKSLLLPFKGN
jgi:hypothetical protein